MSRFQRRGAIRVRCGTISARRRDRSSTIFLTGGTGFLGSHIAAELLRRGYRVLLPARPTKLQSASDRIRSLLRWHDLGPNERERVEVIEAHLDQPCFGVDADTYSSIADRVDEIIHCASSTSFSESKREEIENTNINAMKNVIEFGKTSRCYFFHHVSTAYVAGRKEGSCAEEHVPTEGFSNVYEETKYRGEEMISEACRKEGIRLNIYRPSIVYGDSTTGRTFKFNALYYPIRTILFFRNLFEKDILEKDGRKAEQMGVKMNGNGCMFLPIRIEAHAAGGINLIPVDFLVTAFLQIMEDSVEGDLFHIVSPKLTPIQEVVDYTKLFFNIEGIDIVPPGSLVSPRNGLEILFDHYIKAYQPYIADNRVFEWDKANKILSANNVFCPDFDSEMYARCMSYAVKTEWGTRRQREEGREI